MNPEQIIQFEAMQKQIEDLTTFINNMKSDSTIPIEIDQSFPARFKFAKAIPSTKTAASETQAVNEGGSSSYNVSKPPDGFVKILVDGVYREVPYFT